MYLKELTLRGFKSFANPTTLRFEPGVTAIVGPNGSGKSNIVDALAWVMGEQGAKSLRGTSMEDVIFAGTSTRPPLGRAQVTLTIDNADHALDIDYTEVSISRTIYRNGGSEYAINGSPVRLLDVQELLSDTGLGSHMHVVVGQGRLDSILRATPADNRAFIEEAAGILKHRKRKERAQRKLASTQANLARLEDVTKEIHRQLGPLRRQARVSRQADAIHVIIRDAQSRLYADDAATLVSQRDDIREQLTQARNELNEKTEELTTTKRRIDALEALSRESNPKLGALNQSWHDLAQTRERLTALSDVAIERARSYESRRMEPSGEDPTLLDKRADELDKQAAQKAKERDEKSIAREAATQARADAESQLADVRQTLGELRRASQKRTERAASIRERMARESALADADVQRRADTERELKNVTAQAADARARVAELEKQSSVDSADEQGSALDAAREAQSQAREARDRAEAEHRRLEGEAISALSTARALDEALGAYDGEGGARLAAGISVLGRLSDFIRVEAGWENAVARVLGVFDGAQVVRTLDEVAKCLDDVANNVANDVIKSGSDTTSARANRQEKNRQEKRKSAFIPAKGAALIVPQEKKWESSLQAPRGARPASALVSANPRAKDQVLAAHVTNSVCVLLSDVLAVETPREGIQALAVGAGWRRAVTQKGDLICPVGGVAGDAATSTNLAIAARRDAALTRHAELVKRRDAAQVALDAARDRFAQATGALDEARARDVERRTRLREAARAVESARSQAEALERRVAELARSVERLAASAESHRATVESLQADVAVLDSAGSGEADFSELHKREQQLDLSLTTLREAEVAARMAWDEAKRAADSLGRQADLLRENAQAARRRAARIREMNEALTRKAAQARHVAVLARTAAGELSGHIARLQSDRDEAAARAAQHDGELTVLRDQRDQLEPIVAQLRSREHDLDVTRERLATQYGALEQKIGDELGMMVKELIAEYGPDKMVPVLDEDGRPVPLKGETENDSHPDFDGGSPSVENDTDSNLMDGAESTVYRMVPYVREEQEKRLAKAQRDLAALGKVNPLAGEEYDALEERSRYINEQRRDVIASRDDLVKLIKDLDSTMVDVFAAAFQDTATAFEKVFATLFPGGTGRLRLEDPDDMLSTGVIVEASPAGKRVKQLSLLSGGERSLTALALLFAIFTARPSPFYIMDEVEAALDDVNLTRLLTAIDDLREHAQLIIITHQQRTMSIADALYGVTMRADGVTAVVSSKLDHSHDAKGAGEAPSDAS